MTSSTTARFPFIDSDHAAEMLDVSRADILHLIEEGRLASYGGKERNPFVRTADVERLAEELGRPAVVEGQGKARTKSPVKRVQLRINADARWADITDEDIETWCRNLEPTTRRAARQVVERARTQLEHVLELLTPDD